MQEVILSGGESGGKVVSESDFIEDNGFKYFVIASQKYRLTEQVDANGLQQAVFCEQL